MTLIILKQACKEHCLFSVHSSLSHGSFYWRVELGITSPQKDRWEQKMILGCTHYSVCCNKVPTGEPECLIF